MALSQIKKTVVVFKQDAEGKDIRPFGSLLLDADMKAFSIKPVRVSDSGKGLFIVIHFDGKKKPEAGDKVIPMGAAMHLAKGKTEMDFKGKLFKTDSNKTVMVA